MVAPSPVPNHETVRVLRPGRSLLLRNGQTGALVVARRLAAAPALATRRLRTLARARHHCLGPAPALIVVDGVAWAVRPWIEGQPLAERLCSSPLDLPEALSILRDVSAALAAVHARGGVHGELHASNVICAASGRARLVDGGDPPPFPPDAADANAVVEASYAAPELVRGRSPSRSSDLFSLAVLAHEMLAGEHPFRAPDSLETARRILHHEAPDLAALRTDLPRELAAATARALSKRRVRRLGAAASLAEALGPAPAAALPAETPATTEPALSRALTLVTGTVRLAAAKAGTGAYAAATRGAARYRASRRFRVGIVAAGVAAMAIATLGPAVLRRARDGALSARVAARLDAGDVAGAERLVRESRRGRSDPLAQKLLGDIGCARGDHAECLRRYGTALESGGRFESDDVVRRNALALLPYAQHRAALISVLARLDAVDERLAAATRSDRYWTRWNAVRALEARHAGDRVGYAEVYALDLLHAGRCATRRAAAAKLAWLGDPRVVPQLERAEAAVQSSASERRCLGDAVERALDASRGRRLARR